jgi:adenylate kinase
MGDLLRKEIVKGTSIGDEIEALVAEGVYVQDQIVVDVLCKHLDQVAPSSVVFVEGFPKTLMQYKLLLEKGILPDGIIRLEDYMENKRRKAKDKFGDEDPRKGLDYLEIFERQMLPVENAYKDLVHKVHLSEGNTLEKIARVLRMRLATHISSPYKILLLRNHIYAMSLTSTYYKQSTEIDLYRQFAR